MSQANPKIKAPPTPASDFLIAVNRLQISLMIRDPFVAAAFARAERDGLAPAPAEVVRPDDHLDGGVVCVPELV